MSVSSQVYTLTDNVVYFVHKRHFIRGKIVECGRNYAALQQFLKNLLFPSSLYNHHKY